MSRWIMVVALSVAGVALSTPDAAAFGGRLFKKKSCPTPCYTPCAPVCHTPCAMPMPCHTPAPAYHTGYATPAASCGGCGGHMPHHGHTGGSGGMCAYGSYHGGMSMGGGCGGCY